LICLSVVIVREVYFPFLDSKQKVEETLETPFLGTIVAPTSRWKKLKNIKKGQEHITDMQFFRAEDEDFSKLAANIHYLTKQKSVKTIMVTSLEVGDGKTFIGCNLAAKLALNGQKTLFIDANLRGSDSRKRFNLPDRKGLTSIISGYYEKNQVIQDTSTDNLSFLSTGPLPPNPAQFLQSKKMTKMLDELKEQFDVIIIDTPALTKADTISLLPSVDGCIYVADASKTHEEKAFQSLESIKKVGGAILGVVINSKVKASNRIVHF
ncbi:CpsD/CapB family tyrosine-protein kinase, partial [Microvirga sp. 3-52]|nr:CpsD/CapB family tyrosine-protein kinase [Microvirga sp. 3-52]